MSQVILLTVFGFFCEPSKDCYYAQYLVSLGSRDTFIEWNSHLIGPCMINAFHLHEWISYKYYIYFI